MNCPCFKDNSIGLCDATQKLRAPSISEMEKYCFRTAFRYCPTFHKSESAASTSKSISARKNCNETSMKCA
ncbi:MAG TPA: hypothetical protein VMB78_01915 [Dissulfurispiraceae bacterium]|nr:hypothetical protein [Dissulfurispiraceae bacterium]